MSVHVKNVMLEKNYCRGNTPGTRAEPLELQAKLSTSTLLLPLSRKNIQTYKFAVMNVWRTVVIPLSIVVAGVVAVSSIDKIFNLGHNLSTITSRTLIFYTYSL